MKAWHLTVIAAALAAILLAPAARALDYPEKWVYLATNLAVDDNVTKTIDLLRKAKRTAARTCSSTTTSSASCAR